LQVANTSEMKTWYGMRITAENKEEEDLLKRLMEHSAMCHWWISKETIPLQISIVPAPSKVKATDAPESPVSILVPMNEIESVLNDLNKIRIPWVKYNVSQIEMAHKVIQNQIDVANFIYTMVDDWKNWITHQEVNK
jgi:hypothetical protein